MSGNKPAKVYYWYMSDDKKTADKEQPESADIIEAAKEVLSLNDREGKWTIPADGLYPHQWLWDSAFIAIGLSHYDTERAQQEILSILRGQWANGMVPHMIFDSAVLYRQDREIWRSYVSPYAPDNVATSGITQPPMLAEAIVRIGKKLKLPERRSWYRHVYQALVNYHQWLYTERDTHGEGLTLQIHPWETGMDNTPPWMHEMHQHLLPFWVRFARLTHLEKLFTYIRKDVRFAAPRHRMTNVDVMALYSVQRRLRRKQYDIQKLLTHSLFAIEDLAFNSIFIRANHHLRHIAKTIGEELPEELTSRMRKTESALEQLWDAYSGQYYCRNFTTHKLIKVSTIATFLPLYAGSISKERADQLVSLLKTSKQFSPKYPIATAPVNADYFNEFRYWQGPVWINMNWLIIDGLRQYKHDDLADKLTEKTLELIKQNGFYEYFSPLTGEPAGINNFSWTAALAIDLLNRN